MNRDSNGKFIAKEKVNIEVPVPHITSILFWVFVIIVLLPWISIVIRNELLGKLFALFDRLISGTVFVQQTVQANGQKDPWSA